MYYSEKQYFVEMMINGAEMPLPPGSFEDITIVQNINMYLPQFRVNLPSPADAMDGDRQVVDGTPITLFMGRSLEDGEEDTPTIELRAFGPPQHNTSVQGRQSLYTIVGFLDAMKYLRDQPKGVIDNTSANAIAQLAAECGLTPIVDATADRMKWIKSRQSYASLCAHYCNMGWASPTSMMSLGVDEEKRLYYKDLVRLIGQGPVRTLWIGDNAPGGAIHMESFNPKYISGLNNNLFSYGTFLLQEQLDGGIKEFTEVSTTKFSNTIEINSGVKGEMERVRTIFSAAECGNVHPNWMMARHQNARNRSSFSMQIETETQRPTGVNLYDIVEFYIDPKASPQMAEMLNANYIVTAKTRCIRGTEYYEKIRIMGQGRNVDRTGALF